MSRAKSPVWYYILRASEVFDVPHKSIIGPRRFPKYTWPRFAAIYRAYREGDSMTNIGRAIGKDRTTVRNAIEKAEIFIEYFPEFKEKVFLL